MPTARRGRLLILGALLSLLVTACGREDPAPGSSGRPLAVAARTYPLSQLLQVLRDSWTAGDSHVHADVTGLILGHWVAAPERAVEDLPELLAFVSDGTDGLEGLLWSAAAAARSRRPELVPLAVEQALRQADVLATASERDLRTLVLPLVDLTAAEGSDRSVVLLPNRVRPELLQAFQALETEPVESDQLIRVTVDATDQAMAEMTDGELFSYYGMPGSPRDPVLRYHLLGALRGGMARQTHGPRLGGRYLGGLTAPLLDTELSTEFTLGNGRYAHIDKWRTYDDDGGWTDHYLTKGTDPKTGQEVIWYRQEQFDANGVMKGYQNGILKGDRWVGEHYVYNYDSTGQDYGKGGTFDGPNPLKQGGQGGPGPGASSGGSNTGGTGEEGSADAEESEAGTDGGSGSGGGSGSDGGASGNGSADAEEQEAESAETASAGAPEDTAGGDDETYPLPTEVEPVPLPWYLKGVDEFVLAIGAGTDPWINPGPDHDGGLGIVIIADPVRGDIDPPEEEGPVAGPDAIIPDSIEWYF